MKTKAILSELRKYKTVYVFGAADQAWYMIHYLKKCDVKVKAAVITFDLKNIAVKEILGLKVKELKSLPKENFDDVAFFIATRQRSHKKISEQLEAAGYTNIFAFDDETTDEIQMNIEILDRNFYKSFKFKKRYILPYYDRLYNLNRGGGIVKF